MSFFSIIFVHGFGVGHLYHSLNGFLASGMPVGSKLNIISYIGIYYATGAAWVMTLTNFIAGSLYNRYLDKWYVELWKTWLSIIMVFSVCWKRRLGCSASPHQGEELHQVM